MPFASVKQTRAMHLINYAQLQSLKRAGFKEKVIPKVLVKMRASGRSKNNFRKDTGLLKKDKKKK
jgi:hypothetical protein